MKWFIAIILALHCLFAKHEMLESELQKLIKTSDGRKSLLRFLKTQQKKSKLDLKKSNRKLGLPGMSAFQSLGGIAAAGGLAYYLNGEDRSEENDLFKKIQVKKTELVMSTLKKKKAENLMLAALRQLRNKTNQMDAALNNGIRRLNSQTDKLVSFMKL